MHAIIIGLVSLALIDLSRCRPRIWSSLLRVIHSYPGSAPKPLTLLAILSTDQIPTFKSHCRKRNVLERNRPKDEQLNFQILPYFMVLSLNFWAF
ncbi:hypothetical protein RRG08_014547 [Elysia crispata]|uniref:Secreted protein n=1 Tax=Elysia crispata TaxID=231223 RepID=A0AAE1CQ09_9GAST|nr:hypothetical protein RRG08_014547 [Elysia crispata]